MKFSTIGLAIIGAIAGCVGAVEDYSLAWNGCDKALGDISGAEKANIFCAYDILPVTSLFKAEMFGWSGVKGDACVGPKPDQVKFTNVGVIDGFSHVLFAMSNQQTADHSSSTIGGDIFTDIDIDRSKFQNQGSDETFHFCIRNDVMVALTGGTPASMNFIKTFITVNFFLDGSFELNADSEGSLLGGDDDILYTGDDDVLFDDVNGGNDFANFFDDPTNGGGVNVTENLTASEVFDEFNKTYSVFAYQCSLDATAVPPHPQVDDIIYQGDNLGICVETLFRDTFIDDVIFLELDQDDGKGTGTKYTTRPVDNRAENVVTEVNCNLENRLNETKSKCFIKTAMLSQFFITQLIVDATGEVDLKIRTSETNPGSGSRRLDEHRKLQGAIDGSYTVRTVVGTVDEVETNSVSSTMKLVIGYTVMLSMLAVNLL